MAVSSDQCDPGALAQLKEQGFAVFERAYSASEVDAFRTLLLSEWERLGRPALAASPPRRLGKDVEVGPAGLIFHRLSSAFPEVAPRLYKRNIIDTIRALLGPGMRLELPAGVLSDHHRPFFDWHTHIGGVDDAYFDNKRPFDDFERSLRVTHLLYLEDLTEENGQLLVLPRRITDPTAPPYACSAQHWPGQVEIECPRGSVVVLEQCTWHAARQKRSPGIRSFVGSYFAAKEAKPTPLSDPDLGSWQGSDSLFASLIPR